MPDLGIGEALAGAFGGGDLLGALGSLFGIGDAAAAAAPAAATGVDAALGAGAGTGLFGGSTGLTGSLLASGATGGIDAALGAGGPTALGTATDFLGSGGAGLLSSAGAGFGAAADAAASQAASTGAGSGSIPGIGAPGGGPGILDAGLNFTPSGSGGTSVFDTASQANGSTLNGLVNSGGAPPAASGLSPAGASASSLAAPTGATVAPADATSALSAGADAGKAAAGGATSSISDLLSPSNLASKAISSLTSNPLGVGLGAAGLGYNIYEGQKNTANQQALAADAQTATANSSQMVQSGEALQQYLTSGTLPPQYQQQVDQAISSAKEQAISNAAGQGQSTDPTKNSTLAATLAGIDNQRAGMISQVAATLFSSGSSLVSAGQSAAGLSGQLYSTLVQNDTTAAANTGKAIATLAAALNGKTNATIGSTNIQVSGT